MHQIFFFFFFVAYRDLSVWLVVSGQSNIVEFAFTQTVILGTEAGLENRH